MAGSSILWFKVRLNKSHRTKFMLKLNWKQGGQSIPYSNLKIALGPSLGSGSGFLRSRVLFKESHRATFLLNLNRKQGGQSMHYYILNITLGPSCAPGHAFWNPRVSPKEHGEYDFYCKVELETSLIHASTKPWDPSGLLVGLPGFRRSPQKGVTGRF